MSDIITVPTGNFAPGALATLQYPAWLINASWNQANDKYAAYEAKSALITNVGGTGWLDTASTPTISSGSASATAPTDPGVTVPSSITHDAIFSSFNTEQQAMWDQMVQGVVAFRSSFFPDEGVAYSAAEDWLQAAIASSSGLPAATAAQMLSDDKDRILAESSRAADALTARFAAARFPISSGAEVAGVLAIQQTAQAEIAASARKITIAGIEQLKFAVEKLIALRQVAMSAALDYVRTLAGAHPAANQLVGTGYDAQSRLISAASSYFGARTAAADLATKNSQFNVANALSAAEANQRATLTMAEDKLKAMLGELAALAQMATSLFGNLHASSGTHYGVSGNDGT